MGFCCCCCDTPNPQPSDHKMLPMEVITTEESEQIVLSDKPDPPSPVKPLAKPPTPKVLDFNLGMGTGKMEFTSYPNGGMGSMKDNINNQYQDNATVLASGLCIKLLLITKKCWGVIGLDLDDGPNGNAARYFRELFEYDLNCNGDGIKPGMSNAQGQIDLDRSDNFSKFGGYGNLDSWKGIFRSRGPRLALLFEFFRGNMAQGVRGIIDPQDPLNPYGFSQLKDLDEDDKKAYKKMLLD